VENGTKVHGRQSCDYNSFRYNGNLKSFGGNIANTRADELVDWVALMV
jgi:hypothetical protein